MIHPLYPILVSIFCVSVLFHTQGSKYNRTYSNNDLTEERIPFKKGLIPKKAISRLMNTIPSIKHSSLSSSSWQHSSWGPISTQQKISWNIKTSYNFLPFSRCVFYIRHRAWAFHHNFRMTKNGLPCSIDLKREEEDDSTHELWTHKVPQKRPCIRVGTSLVKKFVKSQMYGWRQIEWQNLGLKSGTKWNHTRDQISFRKPQTINTLMTNELNYFKACGHPSHIARSFEVKEKFRWNLIGDGLIWVRS